MGHGLWCSYSPAAQRQIRTACATGQRSTTVEADQGLAFLDFGTAQHRTPGAVQAIRCHFQTLFQYSKGRTRVVTSRPADIIGWDDACVHLVSGAVARAAPDGDSLALLCHRGAVDPSLWSPPCQASELLTWDVPGDAQRQRLREALGRFWREAVDTGEGRDELFALPDCAGPRGAARGAAAGSRFVDGLQSPGAAAAADPFYPDGYRCAAGALGFCMALPDNPLALEFAPAPVVGMCRDAVLKVMECRRQGATLGPLHVTALYVYTFELKDQPEQIYGAMNKAMRDHDRAALEFWLPLIWHVDQALLALPAYRGPLYRGIDCRFNESSYKQGLKVCWPAFSSASAQREVAEEFVKGGEGTLFILQSLSARAISAFSKYPEEEEVLFRPNTLFTITSTLYGTSEIGKFYSDVDNIAMAEVSGQDAGAPVYVSFRDQVPALGGLFDAPAPLDTAYLVVQVPKTLHDSSVTTFHDSVATSGVACLTAQASRTDGDGRQVTVLTLQASPSAELQDVSSASSVDYPDKRGPGTAKAPSGAPAPASPAWP